MFFYLLGHFLGLFWIFCFSCFCFPVISLTDFLKSLTLFRRGSAAAARATVRRRGGLRRSERRRRGARRRAEPPGWRRRRWRRDRRTLLPAHVGRGGRGAGVPGDAALRARFGRLRRAPAGVAVDDEDGAVAAGAPDGEAAPAVLRRRREHGGLDGLDAMAQDLFDVVNSGDVQIRIDQEFPLKEARAAHELLETRNTTASTILLP